MTAQPIATAQRLVLEFTVTADDLVDGSRAYYSHRPMLGWLVGPVLVIASLAAFLLSDDLIWLSGVAFGIIATAAGKLRWLDRMILRANPNARLDTPCELEFTGSGIRYSNAGVLGLIEWSAITESREGDRAIVLLSGRAPVANIPKRAFKSQRDLESARALIAARINWAAASGQKERQWLVLPLIFLVVFVVAAVTAFVAR